MKILVILIFFLLVLVTLWGSKNILRTKKAINFCILIMFLLSVFKDGSQIPDHHVYEAAYNLGTQGDKLSYIEFSFSLVSRLFGSFGSVGFNLLLGFYSAIFLLGFRQIMIQNLEIGPSSILLFYSNAFLIFGLIQIRAGAALALIYVIILSNNRKIKRLFMWISAIFLHASSIVFIPLGLLRKKIFKKKTILILLLFSICISPLIIPLLNFITELMPVSYIEQKILTYMLEERTTNLSLNFLGPNFILRFILFMFFIRFYRIFNSPRDRLLLYLYFFGFFTYIAFSSVPEIAFRIANSLFISEIFLIQILCSRFKQKKLIYPVITTYSFLQLLVNIYFTSYFNYTPA